MPGIHHPRTVISFGPFEANLQTQELRKQGVRLHLPGQSFQILKIDPLCWVFDFNDLTVRL